MRSVTVLGIVVLAAMLAAGGSARAQVGRQVIVTMQLAAQAKAAGGAYFIAFTVDDTILAGPEADSTNWTHYVMYRGGRFLFGRVPAAPFRPFEFVAIRPPTPFVPGQVLAGGKTLRARVALSDLQGPAAPAARLKLNFVTVDDQLRPLDALGQGATDRFGFVTVDLRRDTYVPVADRAGDAPDPAFDIVGGDIQLGTP